MYLGIVGTARSHDSRAAAPTVTSADATNFRAPDGCKIATDRCAELSSLPNDSAISDCNPNGPTTESYPVVALGSYTFWPLSYEDDRFVFAVAVADSDMNVINTLEVDGARYIGSIHVDSANRSVNFVGQANATASLAWDTLSLATIGRRSPVPEAALPSNASTASSDSQTSSNGLSVGGIVGIAIGGFVGVILICLFLAWSVKTFKNKKAIQRDQQNPPDPADVSPIAHADTYPTEGPGEPSAGD